MSELKATPGPWELKAPNILSLDRSVKPDGRRRIASLVVAYKGSEEYYANADLIAAAPQLYETLDVLVNSIGQDGMRQLGIEQEMLAAGCALAKARGETL